MCGLQIIIACVEANDVSIIAIFILVGKTENFMQQSTLLFSKS